MIQLKVTSLQCVRGSRLLIDGLSFELPAGGALIVTGPNGAGKSTLLRAIAGLFRPQAGRIALIDHRDANANSDDTLASRCHFIGHLNAIKPQFTVEENARFIARYFEHVAPDAVEDALAQFQMSAFRHIPAAYLSAGQKRRLGLCRLLMVKRPLWLLDEPAVSLDAASQELLVAIIQRHLRDGGIAVVATHTPLRLQGARELRLGLAPQPATGQNTAP